MDCNKRLENLKVGDLVVVNSSYGRREIAKITDSTKVYWKVGSRRFRKTDGVAPGGGYSFSRISEWTPEVDREIRDANALRTLRDRLPDKIKTASLEQLRQVADILLNI